MFDKNDRRLVWYYYFGKQCTNGVCLSCNRQTVSRNNFRISVFDNSKPVTIENVKPVCYNCATNIGNHCVIEYMVHNQFEPAINFLGVLDENSMDVEYNKKCQFCSFENISSMFRLRCQNCKNIIWCV